MLAECPLPVSSPEVVRRADGFLGAVVEIVAERADLALELDGGDQLALVNDQDVPELGRPEISRQRQDHAPLMDFGVTKAVGLHEVDHQGDEAIHVVASGDSSARACVDPTGLPLLLGRLVAIAPERHHGIPGLLLEVREIEAHAASRSGMTTALLGQAQAEEFADRVVAGFFRRAYRPR